VAERDNKNKKAGVGGEIGGGAGARDGTDEAGLFFEGSGDGQGGLSGLDGAGSDDDFYGQLASLNDLVKGLADVYSDEESGEADERGPAEWGAMGDGGFAAAGIQEHGPGGQEEREREDYQAMLSGAFAAFDNMDSAEVADIGNKLFESRSAIYSKDGMDAQLLKALEFDAPLPEEAARAISDAGALAAGGDSFYSELDAAAKQRGAGGQRPALYTHGLGLAGMAKKLYAEVYGLSMRAKALIAAGMLMLIAALAVSGAMFTMAADKAAPAPAPKDADPSSASFVIRHRAGMPNNADYIYIGKGVKTPNGDIVVDKLALNRAESVFYLKTAAAIGFGLMTDDAGNTYCADFYANGPGSENPAPQSGAGLCELSFDALPARTKHFTLFVMGSQGGYEAKFDFHVDGALNQSPARYIASVQAGAPGTPTGLPQTGVMAGAAPRFMSAGKPEPDPLINISIINSAFSSSGSAVNYMISWAGGREKAVVPVCVPAGAPMSLSSNGVYVLPKDSAPRYAVFQDQDMTLGQAVFQPVPSLGSSLKITFDNLYAQYSLNKTVPTEGLFLNTAEGVEHLALDNYDVQLERMLDDQYKCVLVLHTEDTAVEKRPPPPAGSPVNRAALAYNRLETRMDAQLSVFGPDGAETVLDGECTSGDVGTDVVFNYPKGFSRAPLSRMSLRINGISIKLPKQEAYVDLGAGSDKPDANVEAAADAIAEAFKTRLGYKARNVGYNGIEGFAPSVLLDEPLMRLYAPADIGSPYFNARVLAAHSAGTAVSAIVRESWHAPGGLAGPARRDHAIAASVKGDVLRIERDRLLEG